MSPAGTTVKFKGRSALINVHCGTLGLTDTE